MSEINKPDAYFRAVVKNSYKNEYRSNDNFYNHISSVGCEADIQQERSKEKVSSECGTDDIEQSLSELSTGNWLLFIENEQLHKALTSMLPAQLDFLFELAAYDFDQTSYAAAYGVTKQALSDRFRRISKKIKSFSKATCQKHYVMCHQRRGNNSPRLCPLKIEYPTT